MLGMPKPVSPFCWRASGGCVPPQPPSHRGLRRFDEFVQEPAGDLAAAEYDRARTKQARGDRALDRSGPAA